MISRPWFPNGLTGRHVLIGILAFFGVMLAANGVFVYLALSTFGGLDASDAYRTGVNYKTRLAESEAQAARGWTVDVALTKQGDRLNASFLDRSGTPISGLAVTATIGRPATDKADRRIELGERGAGRYGAAVEPLGPGSWVLSLTASRLTSRGEQSRFRLKRRLWVPPES